jgi:hypothetical protein
MPISNGCWGNSSASFGSRPWLFQPRRRDGGGIGRRQQAVDRLSRSEEPLGNRRRRVPRSQKSVYRQARRMPRHQAATVPIGDAHATTLHQSHIALNQDPKIRTGCRRRSAIRSSKTTRCAGGWRRTTRCSRRSRARGRQSPPSATPRSPASSPRRGPARGCSTLDCCG